MAVLGCSALWLLYTKKTTAPYPKAKKWLSNTEIKAQNIHFTKITSLDDPVPPS